MSRIIEQNCRKKVLTCCKNYVILNMKYKREISSFFKLKHKYMLMKDVEKNYVNKNKIIDKIKELEYTYQCEEEENGYNDETYMYYIPQIKVLKQLLEEN